MSLIGIDHQADVAAIQLDVDHDLEAIPIGDARSLRPGDLLLAMGFPWGIGSGLTFGSIIEITSWPGMPGGDQRSYISASLHLRPDHSGGPMFNTAGELVGLNTVMLGPDVGVAIPVHQAARAIKRYWSGKRTVHKVPSRIL